MSEEIVIAKAGTRDAGMLTELSVSTFRATFGADNRAEDMDMYVAEAMNEAKVEGELADDSNYFLLAWEDNVAVGYAKIRPNKEAEIDGDNALEIERIYVRKTHHDRKIGALMMQYIINHAKANGHDVLWLGVWERNHRALNFYRRWGFEVCGSHPFLLGNDLQTDVLMRKAL